MADLDLRDSVVQGEDGFPLLLASSVPLRAKKPGQVAPQPVGSGAAIRRGAVSGNPSADPISGRFAGPGGGNTGAPQLKVIGGRQLLGTLIKASQDFVIAQIQASGANQIRAKKVGNEVEIQLLLNGVAVMVFTVATVDSEDTVKKEQETASNPQFASTRVPDGVDEVKFTKRLDAIRDAARATGDLDEDSVKAFLKDRVENIDQVNLPAFIADAREQRLDDLLDILDQQLRGKVKSALAARNEVQVKAPKAWAKRVFAGLTDQEVIKLVVRLEGRGWDAEDLTKHIIGRIKNKKRRAQLEQLYGERKPKSGKKEGDS